VIPKRLLWRTFWRTYFVGAVYTMRGLQNVGMVFILHPALCALYAHDPAALQRARHRYLGLYNTHPCWTPALVGLFLSLEERIARGLLAPQALAAVRSTVVFTLSGLGDAFFSGGVFVLWALVQCFLLVRGLWLWAGVWTVVALTAVQVMKMVTFFRAYSRGLAFLQDLKRWDLINWARHIKVVCAVALAAVVGAVAAPLGPWAVVLMGTGAGVSGLLAPGGPWRLVVLAGVGLAWIVGQWA